MSSAGATEKVSSMNVVSFEAPGLGDRSYLISDGEVALVVDAQRDPLVYLQEAEILGVRITGVLETHIHNDYVSGGLALARATGALYGIPAGEAVSFPDDHRAFGDGATFRVGKLTIKAIATTGHTDHHLSYLVSLAGNAAGDTPQQVVCTGGSLLTGTTGRTDLLGPEKAERLSRSQWRSVRRLLMTLPSETRIYPTHGFGSFCSATPSSAAAAAVTTVAEELQQNPAALMDEEQFVAAMLAHLPPIPAYYKHMAPLNRKGPLAPRFDPVAVLDGAGLADAVRGPHWVVDLRPRRGYAAEHLRGTVNLELGTNLATYLGWIVPWEAQLILIGEHEAEITEARRLIACIGREELLAMALWPESLPTPCDRTQLGSYRVASFSDLAAKWAGRGPDLHLVDVRHPHEWDEGHVVGAQHLPLQELVARRAEVATTGRIWVHCGGGFRAAAAASLLSGWNLSAVLIDDTWQHAVETGLPITTSEITSK